MPVGSAYINSIFTTAFVGFDRYVAVRYSLRYETILKKMKVFSVLFCIWIVSIIPAGIQWVNVNTFSDNHLHLLTTLSSLSFTTSDLVLSVETTYEQYSEEVKLFRR